VQSSQLKSYFFHRQRGQADGFAIDILPKLKDVRSKDNATNLLQYIVRFYILRFDERKGSPEASLPVPEPSDVERSSNINFDTERVECAKLKSTLASIEATRQRVVDDVDAADHVEPFGSTMAEFLSKATVSTAELSTLVDECAAKFARTMRFYQYHPQKSNSAEHPKEFFEVWLPFCTDFKNLWKKEQARIEKELLMEERARHKQKKENLKSFKTKPVEAGSLKDRLSRRKSKMDHASKA
jgi:formin 2